MKSVIWLAEWILYLYIYIYIYINRLSYERRGDISFIARGTISYFVMSERSERGTKYDIVTRAIKLILPSLECDNLFITYLCLYLERKPDYIFKFITFILKSMVFPAFWLVKNSAINPQIASFWVRLKNCSFNNRIFFGPNCIWLLSLANKTNQTACIQFTK